MKKLTNEQLQRVNTGVGIAAGLAGFSFTMLQFSMLVKTIVAEKKAARQQVVAQEEAE